MRALVYDGETVGVRERPDPETDGIADAIVRVHRAGVCSTDLEIVKGYMGFQGILGHEFVGHVESGPEAWIGKRVVGEINFGCRRCGACAGGLARHCPNRRVMGILDAHGALAERVAVPTANLHPVPDDVPDERAVFCEPLAAAFEILEQLRVEPGEPCAVLGDGKLGLLVAQVLHAAGGNVLAVGRHPEKLAILERRGIRTRAADDLGDERFDLVVEATGTADGFRTAMARTRPRGRLVLKSTVAEPSPLHLAPLVIDEISVVGSRCGPFAPALRALSDGSVDVDSLIGERMGLSRADAALRRAAERGVLKVLVDCD